MRRTHRIRFYTPCGSPFCQPLSASLFNKSQFENGNACDAFIIPFMVDIFIRILKYRLEQSL